VSAQKDKKSLQETTLTGAPAPGAGTALSARLVALSGPLVGAKFPLIGSLKLGRATDNDIAPRDSLLSRYHARIVMVREGVHAVEDLKSRNGTFVNDKQVNSQELRFGDTIRVGETLLLFTHENPVEESQMRSARLELLGRIAAGVAHDFSNLLNAALASLDYLESIEGAAVSDGEVKACVRDARAALRQAATLSSRLVGISREHGHELKPVHVGELCDDVARLLRRTAPSTVQVVVDIPPGLFILGERSRLHQALMNLCLNSRDAMEKGGRLEITARSSSLEKGAPLHATGSVTLKVSDTGVGMRADQIEHAFDPFYSQRDGGTGTGLGLATVLEIVKSHGGRIDIQSEPGAGTVVTVVLPATLKPAQKGPEAPVRVRATTSANGATPIRLLVVDDNQMVRRTLSRLLVRYGFEVVTVDTGQAGLQSLAAEAPDIVLLDIDMPDMQGDEVFRSMRQKRPEVPVVIMSGHGLHLVAKRQGFAGLGTPPFVQKPFDVRQVQAMLRQILARPDSSAGIPRT